MNAGRQYNNADKIRIQCCMKKKKSKFKNQNNLKAGTMFIFI